MPHHRKSQAKTPTHSILRLGPPVCSARCVCVPVALQAPAGVRSVPESQTRGRPGRQSRAAHLQHASEGLPRAMPGTHVAPRTATRPVADTPADGSELTSRRRANGASWPAQPQIVEVVSKCFHQPRPNLRAGGGGHPLLQKAALVLGPALETRALLPEAGSGQGARAVGPRMSLSLRAPEGQPCTRQRP